MAERVVDGASVTPITRGRDEVVPGDVATAAAGAAAAAFGAAAVVADVVVRALGQPWGRRVGAPVRAAQPWPETTEAVDVVLGLSWWATSTGGRLVGGVARLTRPVVGLAMDPPLVPTGLRPTSVVGRLARGWRAERPRAVQAFSAWSAQAAPLAAEVGTSLVDVDRVAGVVLEQVDVEELATLLLDRIDVTDVAVRVLDRIDVDRLVTTVVERIDLQPLVEQVLARLDLNELVTTVLERLELQPLSQSVVERLEVGTLAAAALDQLDLTDLVLSRVDLERIVTAALDELDLTQLVMQRVDLEHVINGALDQLDLTQLVMQRVDLPAIADYVVEEIDLPEMIRDSTGSMASETIQGIRVQGIEADRAVSRVVDRLLIRRRARKTEAVDLEDAMEPEAQPDDEQAAKR